MPESPINYFVHILQFIFVILVQILILVASVAFVAIFIEILVYRTFQLLYMYFRFMEMVLDFVYPMSPEIKDEDLNR